MNETSKEMILLLVFLCKNLILKLLKNPKAAKTRPDIYSIFAPFQKKKKILEPPPVIIYDNLNKGFIIYMVWVWNVYPTSESWVIASVTLHTRRLVPIIPTIHSRSIFNDHSDILSLSEQMLL